MICASLSTAQGPAMTEKFGAPTSRPPTSMTVSDGYSSRLASL